MKKIIYFIEFIIVCFLFILFKLLGYRISSNLGFLIGKSCGPIFRSKRSIIENIKKSNISTKQNYNQLASNVLGNYGRIFSEYPFLKNFRNGDLDKFIEINGISFASTKSMWLLLKTRSVGDSSIVSFGRRIE